MGPYKQGVNALNGAQKALAILAGLTVSGLAVWFWHDNYDRTGFGLAPKDMRMIELGIGKYVAGIKGVAYWASLPNEANPPSLTVCGIVRSDQLITPEKPEYGWSGVRPFIAMYEPETREVSLVTVGGFGRPDQAVADECIAYRETWKAKQRS